MIDSDTETEVSSIVSTPCATLTLEVETKQKTQFIKFFWNRIGISIKKCFAKFLARIEIVENPIQIFSVLFQNVHENSLYSNVEMLSDFLTIEERSKKEVSNENTCEKPSEAHKFWYWSNNNTNNGGRRRIYLKYL